MPIGTSLGPHSGKTSEMLEANKSGLPIFQVVTYHRFSIEELLSRRALHIGTSGNRLWLCQGFIVGDGGR